MPQGQRSKVNGQRSAGVPQPAAKPATDASGVGLAVGVLDGGILVDHGEARDGLWLGFIEGRHDRF